MPRSQFICVWLGPFWNRPGEIRHHRGLPFSLPTLNVFRHPFRIIRACASLHSINSALCRSVWFRRRPRLASPRLTSPRHASRIFGLGSTIIWRATPRRAGVQDRWSGAQRGGAIKFGIHPRFWRGIEITRNEVENARWVSEFRKFIPLPRRLFRKFVCTSSLCFPGSRANSVFRAHN